MIQNWTDLRNAKPNQEIAGLATEYARRALPGSGIEFRWDGDFWIRRVDGIDYPEPDPFSSEPRWDRWRNTSAKYERDVEDYWFHVYQPSQGDVIVDIGAGRGEDVWAFSHAVGPSGTVWGLEPHPVSFAVLDRLCRLNGLENVRRLQVACVDQPAELQIETLPVWESNYVRAGPPGPSSHTVRGVPFDQICEEQGISSIDFLKMNIEGAERSALRGCREALQRARFVCVAAHDFRADRGEGEAFRTLSLVRKQLSEAGFSLVTRNEDPRYYVPYHVHGYR